MKIQAYKDRIDYLVAEVDILKHKLSIERNRAKAEKCLSDINTLLREVKRLTEKQKKQKNRRG